MLALHSACKFQWRSASDHAPWSGSSISHQELLRREVIQTCLLYWRTWDWSQPLRPVSALGVDLGGQWLGLILDFVPFSRGNLCQGWHKADTRLAQVVVPIYLLILRAYFLHIFRYLALCWVCSGAMWRHTSKCNTKTLLSLILLLPYWCWVYVTTQA